MSEDIAAESLPAELPRLLRWSQAIDELTALYHRGGLPRGDLTGWDGLDRFYTVGGGQWTLVTGMPGMGKSEFLDALIVNLAELDSWTFGIYSPENFPAPVHIAKLIEKRCRKPFTFGPHERMSTSELGLAIRWIGERFFWIDQRECSLIELVTTALGFARRPGKRLGVVIDPWNMLDHYAPAWRPAGMNETDYIGAVLGCLTRLLRAEGNENVHVWVVAHPAKLYRGKDGSVPVPSGYDVAGSANFFNKADNIICIHRDKQADAQDVDVIVQKVRFKHVGKVGVVSLKYDKVTGRYFEFDGPTILSPITRKPERYADPESARALELRTVQTSALNAAFPTQKDN